MIHRTLARRVQRLIAGVIALLALVFLMPFISQVTDAHASDDDCECFGQEHMTFEMDQKVGNNEEKLEYLSGEPFSFTGTYTVQNTSVENYRLVLEIQKPGNLFVRTPIVVGPDGNIAASDQGEITNYSGTYYYYSYDLPPTSSGTWIVQGKVTFKNNVTPPNTPMWTRFRLVNRNTGATKQLKEKNVVIKSSSRFTPVKIARSDPAWPHTHYQPVNRPEFEYRTNQVDDEDEMATVAEGFGTVTFDVGVKYDPEQWNTQGWGRYIPGKMRLIDVLPEGVRHATAVPGQSEWTAFTYQGRPARYTDIKLVNTDGSLTPEVQETGKLATISLDYSGLEAGRYGAPLSDLKVYENRLVAIMDPTDQAINLGEATQRMGFVNRNTDEVIDANLQLSKEPSLNGEAYEHLLSNGQQYWKKKIPVPPSDPQYADYLGQTQYTQYNPVGTDIDKAYGWTVLLSNTYTGSNGENNVIYPGAGRRITEIRDVLPGGHVLKRFKVESALPNGHPNDGSSKAIFNSAKFTLYGLKPEVSNPSESFNAQEYDALLTNIQVGRTYPIDDYAQGRLVLKPTRQYTLNQGAFHFKMWTDLTSEEETSLASSDVHSKTYTNTVSAIYVHQQTTHEIPQRTAQAEQFIDRVAVKAHATNTHPHLPYQNCEASAKPTPYTVPLNDAEAHHPTHSACNRYGAVNVDMGLVKELQGGTSQTKMKNVKIVSLLPSGFTYVRPNEDPTFTLRPGERQEVIHGYNGTGRTAVITHLSDIEYANGSNNSSGPRQISFIVDGTLYATPGNNSVDNYVLWSNTDEVQVKRDYYPFTNFRRDDYDLDGDGNRSENLLVLPVNFTTSQPQEVVASKQVSVSEDAAGASDLAALPGRTTPSPSTWQATRPSTTGCEYATAHRPHSTPSPSSTLCLRQMTSG